MQQRRIGNVQVGAMGLGAMPFSVPGRDPEEERSVRTVHAALDAGVTLVDTADAYTLDPADVGHNERLVARALAAYGGDTSSVLVATKGGHVRTPDGGWAVDGRPEYIRRACERSLKALGVDAIGLYQYHRPDPSVPYAETVGTFGELREEGKVRMVGLSNANEEQIRLAADLLGDALVSVQNEYSPRFRSSEPEIGVCAELGLAFLPWSPLGGTAQAGALGSAHAAFAEVAAERGVSPQVVALAWMLAKSGNVVPIPGASRPESIVDSASAADLTLTADELARLG